MAITHVVQDSKTGEWKEAPCDCTTEHNPINLNYLELKWYAKEDDLIGGWCIMLEDKPPSESQLQIGNFLSKEIARYIVIIHNRYLEYQRLIGL